MDTQNLQKLFLPHKTNKRKFDLLRAYNNHLILQIDEMKLHSFHKEEVKTVLQQAITEMMIHEQKITSTSKAQS